MANLEHEIGLGLISLRPSQRAPERSSANWHDTIHLLRIELRDIPGGMRGVIALTLQEREGWLEQAARRARSLVVLLTQTALELYTTDADRRDALRPVLQTFASQVSELPDLGKTRTLEQTGIAVARHLLVYAAEQAALPRDAAESIAEIHSTAALSADFAALGTTLASLFRAAANVGRRVRQETLLNDPNMSAAMRELESLAADRIVEEELATWQAQEAEVERTVRHSIRAEQRTLHAFGSLEPASEVRLRAGRVIDPQISYLPIAK